MAWDVTFALFPENQLSGTRPTSNFMFDSLFRILFSIPKLSVCKHWKCVKVHHRVPQPSVILLSSSPLLFLVYYTNKYNHRRSIKNLKNMTCDISQSHTYDATDFNMPTMDGIGESLHLWVLVVTCSNWRTFLTVCCDRYADLCSGGKRWQCLSHTSNNLANLWIFLDF